MASLASKIAGSKNVKGNIFKEEAPEFISTGCLSLNTLFSGQLDGGVPIGKVSMIASPSSLGKSFIGIKVAKNAQQQHGMTVFYVDTEFAYSPSFSRSVGIDEDNMVVIQNNQIEEVQQILTSTILDLEPEERKKVIIILDSWRGMVTSKTMIDAQSGKDVTDMTISKKKNSLAAILTGIGCTVFVIGGTYETMDQYNPLAIGGGKGIRFACTSIVMGTSKAKSKDGQDINGAIVSARAEKGRMAVEFSKLKFMIRFEGGIHPFYGMLEDALEGGFVEKPTMGWYSRPCVENDRKWREKEVWADDTTVEFWTPIIAKTNFKEYIETKYSFKHSSIHDDSEMLDGMGV